MLASKIYTIFLVPEPPKMPTLEEKVPSIQKKPKPVEGTQQLHIFVLCVFVFERENIDLLLIFLKCLFLKKR